MYLEPCTLLLTGACSQVGVISEPGSVFGEMCVLNNKSWPGEARAKSECTLLEVSRSNHVPLRWMPMCERDCYKLNENKEGAESMRSCGSLQEVQPCLLLSMSRRYSRASFFRFQFGCCIHCDHVGLTNECTLARFWLRVDVCSFATTARRMTLFSAEEEVWPSVSQHGCSFSIVVVAVST